MCCRSQSPRSSTSGGSSESGDTCSGDSDDDLGAQLAEEGLAPDAEALLTSNLLGSRLHPDMTIGGAPASSSHVQCSTVHIAAIGSEERYPRPLRWQPPKLWICGSGSHDCICSGDHAPVAGVHNVCNFAKAQLTS